MRVMHLLHKFLNAKAIFRKLYKRPKEPKFPIYPNIAIFSGDGATTQFVIPHNSGKSPRVIKVIPVSDDAMGDFYVTADDANIYVNYKAAPASGANNVVLSWDVEVW